MSTTTTFQVLCPTCHAPVVVRARRWTGALSWIHLCPGVVAPATRAQQQLALGRMADARVRNLWQIERREKAPPRRRRAWGVTEYVIIGWIMAACVLKFFYSCS